MNRAILRTASDAAVALGLAVVAVLELWLPLGSVQGGGSRELSTAVAVVLCLALFWRRRYPLATALVVLLTWPIVYTIHPVFVLFWGQLVPMVAATYAVARYGSRRSALTGAAAAAASLLFFDFRVPGMNEPDELLFHWLIIPSSWIIGTVVRLAERRAAASAQLAVETELASGTRTIQAISEERARIARELHDIVAHSVSMMVVQAGAAEQVVDDDPVQTRRSLENIRTTGANALAEMRRAVEMLRTADDHVDLRPQPGIHSLPALIESSSNDSLSVHLTTEGAPHPLPAGLDLTVYRIVQEALTNVRRHAAATCADVTLQYETDSVRVSVVDNGSGVANPPAQHGNGVVGMRERAALFGGTLDITSNPGGGITVQATLPAVAP